MNDLLSVSSHPTALTLLYVAGEASLHGALGAGQGDTDPLGLFLRMAMVIIATIDVVVSWSESHTLEPWETRARRIIKVNMLMIVKILNAFHREAPEIGGELTASGCDSDDSILPSQAACRRR